jgi:hypothetical protein
MSRERPRRPKSEGQRHNRRVRPEVTAAAEVRRDLARRVVDRLAHQTALQASLLTGSAGRGTSDDHSDIDLVNYYEELPDPSFFRDQLSKAGAVLEGPLGEPGPDGFIDAYRIDGIQLQTGAGTVSETKERVDRIVAGEVDWISAKVAMGLLEGLPLRGAGLIESWREAVRAYPPSLRRREIERNIGIFPLWAVDAHLAARDAQLFRRQVALDGAFRVMAVLSAVNELYFSTFQFKEMRAHIARMRVAPDHLARRLELVASAPPAEAAEELRILAVETKAIVKAEVPDVDVEAPWRPV